METMIWSIALLLLGLLLIGLEFFVPSAGVIAVLSSLAFVGSIWLAFAVGPREGTLMLLLAVLTIPALVAAAIKWWPHSPLGRLILIKPPASPDDVLPERRERHDLQSLVSKRGRVRVALLPGGRVVVDGRQYEATSEGMPIDVGQTVKVIAVRRERLVVRAYDEMPVTEGPESPSADVLAQPIDKFGVDPFADPLA